MFNKKSNVPIESLKSFSFGYSTSTAYLANVQYDLKCDKKCIATIKLDGIHEEDAKEIEIKYEKVQTIIDFFNENKVYKWDGFQKSDHNVLDGNSFHFYLHEQNGRSIDASGYMMYPKNYKIVREKLDLFFKELYDES